MLAYRRFVLAYGGRVVPLLSLSSTIARARIQNLAEHCGGGPTTGWLGRPYGRQDDANVAEEGQRGHCADGYEEDVKGQNCGGR